ncbi:DUF3369 domain-containing protein [Thalassotalea sp. LPB0316]|uniref:DUF3369 domain-containing protein n=1 Tax=Thalassotalea sp. LPB0316 TaxID=2769490 RepID=UPI001865AA7B|nr:DUF3369 domain-containing protein [Thalassotalea sp. LPB0316]QOL25112.1 DUF3369 domain-containing protein [Thalassotalea sp. LPB0316]
MDWLKEEQDIPTFVSNGTWKVLLVDDEESVLSSTALTLGSFTFEHKKLEFILASSGEEAKQILRERDDIALIFLDVVMETDEAGLDVVQYLRNDLNNHYSRVVLRTGQPGFAPIDDVYRDFDIDGYLPKVKATKQVLQHALYIALRSYRDLTRIQDYQKGLEALINSITNLNQLDDVLSVSQAIMMQLNSVLSAIQSGFVLSIDSIFTCADSNKPLWRIFVDKHSSQVLTKNSGPDLINEQQNYLSEKALTLKESFTEQDYYVHYYRSNRGTETVFMLKSEQKLIEPTIKLLHAFSIQVVLILENLSKQES